uniref:Uncharacterized protein n=1 Tax=Vitis vinifera TaxID=29760 RepID=A5AY21_VITVI|nr:hypothetical protein VITISV_032272 [Vitis vinifera]
MEARTGFSSNAVSMEAPCLKSCEPEFLVATPERLLELISLKAIDISGVSLLDNPRMVAYTQG